MEETCTSYKIRLRYKAKTKIPQYPTDYPQSDLNLAEIVCRDHFGSLELISTNSPTLPFSCLPLANIEQEVVLRGTWDPQVWSKSWSLESSGHIGVIKPPTFVGEKLTVNEQTWSKLVLISIRVDWAIRQKSRYPNTPRPTPKMTSIWSK